jgi:tetratricopeptide (TPR) repeat protein
MIKFNTFPHLGILLFILFFAVSPAKSQEEDVKLKDMFLEAESFFLFEEYKDALPLYQRILQADPENFNINYKIGICYLNDLYQKHKSIQYLEKAILGTSPDYKQNNFKERMAPLEAFYYLGNAYRINNRLNDALEAYDHFKQLLDPVIYDDELVEQQIKACKVASDLISRPNYFVAVNLSEGINERFEEINPVISGDESVLVFTRKLQFYDAVFYSEKRNGKWTYPVNLTPSFAVDGNCYSTGLSYDGKELFVYRLDEFDGNLYVSKRDGDKWSRLVKLNDNINTKYWESHASVSKDGRTLYFTSNRKDGYGGLDIYKSERTRSGDWGPAVNLGPVINTKYNEESPFISEDGRILFFSSMGHYNMGDYDIFYSSRLDNGQWSKPVNIGYPVNTTGDDVFFTPVKNGEYAYYSTYDATDSYGLADIYKMEVFSDLHPRKFILNGIARIEDNLKVDFNKVMVTLINRKTNAIVDQTSLSRDGSFSINATSGDFELVFQGGGIQKTTENISIPINSPSNIIAYTSPLIAPGLVATAPISKPGHAGTDKDLPLLISNFSTLEVDNGDPIPIKLDLERNSQLTVETFVNDTLEKTETFDITRKRFIYMFTPEPGTNILKLTLKDESGKINTHEIVINYIPAAAEITESRVGALKTDPISEFYQGLILLSSGNLRKFLESTDPASLSFTSISDLYNYLISQAPAHGYNVGEVDALFIELLASKDYQIFRNELLYVSSGNLKTVLDTLGASNQRFVLPDVLLDQLYLGGTGALYSQDEVRQLLMETIVSGNRDIHRFVKILQGHAGDTLSFLLDQLDLQALAVNRPDQLIGYLYQQYPYLEDDLDQALRDAASGLDLMFLYQSLLYISGDSLKKTVSAINPDREKIMNSQQLIEYLWKKSSVNGYSKEELMNTIDNIRKDPYHYVEMFRMLLSSRATGSLKNVIDELDIRAMHIDTFEELLDYLIRQSEFHDYNRETVYRLLLDIINPASLEEFMVMLNKHASQHMLNALNEMNSKSVSTPLEVIQYLISVSNEFNFTERDVLNILLKMVLEKGLGPDGSASGKGILHYLTKPGTVKTLILINGIILIIIIYLVFRKKSKKA